VKLIRLVGFILNFNERPSTTWTMIYIAKNGNALFLSSSMALLDSKASVSIPKNNYVIAGRRWKEPLCKVCFYREILIAWKIWPKNWGKFFPMIRSPTHFENFLQINVYDRPTISFDISRWHALILAFQDEPLFHVLGPMQKTAPSLNLAFNPNEFLS